MSRFPTGVCVVTSTDADGRAHGLTCSSLTSVCVAPPTLAVCLKMGSPTLAAIQSGRRFAVNLLHSRARMAAEVFSAPVPHRFDMVRWRPSPQCGLPWLDADSLGLAECGLTGEVPAGDHVVVFGEVLGVTVSGGVPLLYGMRQYSAWPASEVLDEEACALEHYLTGALAHGCRRSCRCCLISQRTLPAGLT